MSISYRKAGWISAAIVGSIAAASILAANAIVDSPANTTMVYGFEFPTSTAHTLETVWEDGSYRLTDGSTHCHPDGICN